MFAKILDNKIVQYPIIDIRNLFEDVSLPSKLTDSNMPEGYCIVHPVPVPTVLDVYKKVVPGVPKYNGTQWTETWDILDLSEQEAKELKQTLSKQVREKRDSLLKQDVDTMNPIRWTMLTEAQQQAWIDYRQKLLDIPQQPGFPESVQWPIKP